MFQKTRKELFFVWGEFLMGGNGFEKNGPFTLQNQGQNINKLQNGHKSLFEVRFGFLRCLLGGFGGGIRPIKVISEFWFGHPKCHFWYPQNGSNGVILGVPKMALRVPESKFWDHFIYLIPPQNPQKDPLGTRIGPWKVIFGHFAFFFIFWTCF